jgi:ATP-dependent DNA helicase RecG
MASGERMGRLLQGDVGSGKTVVAMLAMADAASSGLQSALMAPTEILARQHYETLAPPLEAQAWR